MSFRKLGEDGTLLAWYGLAKAGILEIDVERAKPKDGSTVGCFQLFLPESW